MNGLSYFVLPSHCQDGGGRYQAPRGEATIFCLHLSILELTFSLESESQEKGCRNGMQLNGTFKRQSLVQKHLVIAGKQCVCWISVGNPFKIIAVVYSHTYILNRFEAHCRKPMILCPCYFWGLFWCIFCLLCVNFKHFQFRYRDFVSNFLSSFRMVDSAIKHHVSLVRHFAFAAIHSSVLNLGLCDDATGSGKPFVGAACFGFCESFQETQRQPAPREAANKGTGQWNRIVSIWPSTFLSYPNQSAYHCNIIHNSYENHCHEKNILIAGKRCLCWTSLGNPFKIIVLFGVLTSSMGVRVCRFFGFVLGAVREGVVRGVAWCLVGGMHMGACQVKINFYIDVFSV